MFPLCHRLRRNLRRRVHGSTKVATKVATKGRSLPTAPNTYIEFVSGSGGGTANHFPLQSFVLDPYSQLAHENPWYHPGSLRFEPLSWQTAASHRRQAAVAACRRAM